MEMIILEARQHLDLFVIEHQFGPIPSIYLVQCEQALLTCKTYEEISRHLSQNLNNDIVLNKKRKRWHVITFGQNGGESMLFTETYYRVRFAKLIIEIFSTGKR